jgi:hypothetical protein
MAALVPSSLVFQTQANMMNFNQQNQTTDDLELPSHLNLDDIFTNIAPPKMQTMNYRMMSLQNAYKSALATQQYPIPMNSMAAIGSHFAPVTPSQSSVGNKFDPAAAAAASDLEPKPLAEMFSFPLGARVSPSSVPTNNFLRPPYYSSYAAPITRCSQTVNPSKRSFGALEVAFEESTTTTSPERIPQSNRRYVVCYSERKAVYTVIRFHSIFLTQHAAAAFLCQQSESETESTPNKAASEKSLSLNSWSKPWQT